MYWKLSIVLSLSLLLFACERNPETESPEKVVDSSHKQQLTEEQKAALAERPSADGKYRLFGSDPSLETEPLTLTQAIEEKKFDEKIRLTGEVTAVCQKKGCWIKLTDGKYTLRTRFKDYAFFMPKDIAGQTVILEGKLSEKVLSQDMARHYAEDAGKSREEIEKITGDSKEYAVMADAVLLPQ